MMAARRTAPLIDRLPVMRGRVTSDAPLAPYTWFRAGGAAEVLFVPADADDLADFLANKPDDVPVTIIGIGSNLLVRDGGIDGVVIRLARAFGQIKVEGMHIRAGAAALDSAVARTAAQAGIEGLSFYRGIPGAIGGAVAMNAGCYGTETCDVLVSADVMLPNGTITTVLAGDLAMTYRKGNLPEGAIVLAATFLGRPGDPATIEAQMNEITAAREGSQPVKSRTGGSTFKNPDGAKSWQLIDAAGCRGLRVGGAMVSEKHCNFLIADDGASAADIEALGEEVRRRVLEVSGVDLHWEIRRIGNPS